MSHSTRERAEGFQRPLSTAVETTHSERAEGFQRLLPLTSEDTASERAEAFVTRHHRP